MLIEKIRDLGEFEFYEHYVIGRVDEGVDAGSQFVGILTDIIQKHYSGRPIIYISDRVNSYSLDTTAASDLIARNNICFVGFVTYTDRQKRVYPVEEHLIEGAEICSFDYLGAAVKWAKQKSLEIN